MLLPGSGQGSPESFSAVVSNRTPRSYSRWEIAGAALPLASEGSGRALVIMIYPPTNQTEVTFGVFQYLRFERGSS